MKSLSQLLADWRASRTRMQTLTANLPRIIGAESVKVVKQNFSLQGYDSGSGIAGWEKRKPATNRAYDRRSGVKGSVYNSSNPILLQSRNLFNAVQYQASVTRVTIGVDKGLIPYAKKMNEGGKGTPARKYIPGPTEKPNSKMLKRYQKKIMFERDKAMKEFKK